jgi:glycosyltransferase involved in cell wall biosynthesis
MNTSNQKLSVIVPAFNEEATIAAVIEKLLGVPSLLEIIVVDDASTDRTFSIVQALRATTPQLRLLRQSENMGKTAALKTGFAASVGDIVIVQDADLEYDPAEIQDVIQPILNGVADVVYGSRFLVRKAARVLYFYHYLANKALTFFSNLLTNINLSDVETGYKAFRGEIIRDMIITSSGFGFEIEVTAKVCKLGCACFEVPISYYGRTYDEGKKIGLKMALRPAGTSCATTS